MALQFDLEVVVKTTQHTHTVIFLHGRGSDAQTFHSELFETQDSDGKYFKDLFPGVRWVLPRAQKSWSKLDKEEICQWFEMSSVQRPQEDFEAQKPGLWESVTRILAVLKEEAELVGLQHIIVAGISQGCATAIFTLLASGVRVGGFIGIAGWMPLAKELQDVSRVPGRSVDVLQTPVLLQHCRDDDVMPLTNGEDLAMRLEDMGMQVQWQSFDTGGHWLNEPEGMDAVVQFIKTVMGYGEVVTS